MYCQYCGTEVGEQSRFCSSCGQALTFDNQEIVNTMYCNQCGSAIVSDAKFCPNCGRPVQQVDRQTRKTGPVCSKCGSSNIDIQTFQENLGTTTVSKTKSKYREKRHGLFWWLFIGWWWWMFDIFIWIFAWPLKILARLFHKKKYVGTSVTSSQSINNITYRTMAICKNCGNKWTIR